MPYLRIINVITELYLILQGQRDLFLTQGCVFRPFRSFLISFDERNTQFSRQVHRSKTWSA